MTRDGLSASKHEDADKPIILIADNSRENGRAKAGDEKSSNLIGTELIWPFSAKRIAW